MRLKILFHDNCFDGACSAAAFSRFYREKVNPAAEVEYQGLHHSVGAVPIDDKIFTGDENAILDFRYSQSPRLTWWFDHHQSAFQNAGDEEHFLADRSGRKFHDPTRKSNTWFMAQILEKKFGWDAGPLAEMLRWAEIIDGAQFDSPQMAVELAEPALRLMTVLEANRDPELTRHVIADLQRRSLPEIVAEPAIGGPFAKLFDKHRQVIEVVRGKARYENGVVTFDVADEGLDSINKFISYYLYPDARYTVWVGRGPQRAKVSIGSNPWRPGSRRHDLSKIAERYGGGGHPVVAAISFKADEVEKARTAAAEIVAELQA